MANFQRLDQVIDALPNEAAELRVTVSPAEWDEMLETLDKPINYDETRRGAAKCETKKGKRTRAHFCVCICRTDQGIYELMCNT